MHRPQRSYTEDSDSAEHEFPPRKRQHPSVPSPPPHPPPPSLSGSVSQHHQSIQCQSQEEALLENHPPPGAKPTPPSQEHALQHVEDRAGPGRWGQLGNVPPNPGTHTEEIIHQSSWPKPTPKIAQHSLHGYTGALPRSRGRGRSLPQTASSRTARVSAQPPRPASGHSVPLRHITPITQGAVVCKTHLWWVAKRTWLADGEL